MLSQIDLAELPQTMTLVQIAHEISQNVLYSTITTESINKQLTAGFTKYPIAGFAIKNSFPFKYDATNEQYVREGVIIDNWPQNVCFFN